MLDSIQERGYNDDTGADSRFLTATITSTGGGPG